VSDPSTDLIALFNETKSIVARALQWVDWAEEEIDHAGAQHPAHGDDLFHAFPLLTPTVGLMSTQFVYRSHCRELLARVVTGDDTRPPTNAEIAAACCETSLLGPLKPGGFTVYMRAFGRAFPDKAGHLSDDIEAYEHVAGPQADDLERGLRRKLTVKDRTLRDVTCTGRHHGQSAFTCRYYTPEQLGLGLPLTDPGAR
jgi:hypothetical protein